MGHTDKRKILDSDSDDDQDCPIATVVSKKPCTANPCAEDLRAVNRALEKDLALAAVKIAESEVVNKTTGASVAGLKAQIDGYHLRCSLLEEDAKDALAVTTDLRAVNRALEKDLALAVVNLADSEVARKKMGASVAGLKAQIDDFSLRCSLLESEALTVRSDLYRDLIDKDTRLMSQQLQLSEMMNAVVVDKGFQLKVQETLIKASSALLTGMDSLRVGLVWENTALNSQLAVQKFVVAELYKMLQVNNADIACKASALKTSNERLTALHKEGFRGEPDIYCNHCDRDVAS
jgi:rRNA-processing protein FCF1